MTAEPDFSTNGGAHVEDILEFLFHVPPTADV